MKWLEAIFRRIKNTILNIIYPPTCLSCNKPVQMLSTLCVECWKQLAFVTSPYCYQCGSMSVIPDASPRETYCFQCFNKFKKVKKGVKKDIICRSVLIYNHICRNILHNLKLRRHTDAKFLISRWMYGVIQREEWHEIDLIVPTPLHVSKLRRRGFNQCIVLCRELSKLSKIQCVSNLLIRHKKTKTQGPLTARQRHQNVRDAFSVNPKLQNMIKNRKILIVDDLRTTGATMTACAKTLKPFKPQKLYGLTFARTL